VGRNCKKKTDEDVVLITPRKKLLHAPSDGGQLMNKSSIFAILLLVNTVYTLPSAGQETGVTRPISMATFTQDSDVKCLRYAVEFGNPDAGPSTHLLEFPKGCAYPWHYHSAVEQLMVVRGTVSVQMGKNAAVVLTAGGYAIMPSKEPHSFSCVSDAKCRAFVQFDRAYDIVWIKRE
jgi:quercetin dioxygenase-like cupin family protein